MRADSDDTTDNPEIVVNKYVAASMGLAFVPRPMLPPPPLVLSEFCLNWKSRDFREMPKCNFNLRNDLRLTLASLQHLDC